MNLDHMGIGRKPGYGGAWEKTPQKKNVKNASQDFLESLNKETMEGKAAKVRQESAMAAPFLTKHPGIRTNAVTFHLTETEVRGLSYRQCDEVKFNMEDGCVYKMQVDRENQRVYVEVKSEDGSVRGFDAVCRGEEGRDGSDPIVRAAWEAWDQREKKF